MDRAYIRTERAHWMCPNMHFAVCARIAAPYRAEAFEETLLALQKAHPFLRSVVASEPSGALYYDVRDALPIDSAVCEDEGKLFEDYARLAGNGWDVQNEALLRILIYPDAEDFLVAFTAHHLLCDGRGLWQLAAEFAERYAQGKEPTYAPETPIRALSDLPEKSGLPFISRVVVNSANKNWAKERHSVRYDEYLAFEKRFLRENPLTYSLTVTPRGKTDELAALCKQNGVSVNDYLVAKMMLEENANKVVIAADVRGKLACYRPGALGNYATALSVESDQRIVNEIEKAKDVSRRARAKMADNRSLMLVLACYLAMTPELIDAVAISTLGDFPSKAGRFVGANLFGYAQRRGLSLTNLGKAESRAMTEAFFIPPASPANRKTVGALTLNGVLRLCAAEYAVTCER